MKARFYLKKLSAGDFEAFYSLAGNEQVMKMITGKPLSREEARVKFKALLEIKAEEANEAELGYMLLPVFWGLGYGTEIAEFLMRRAESDPDLSRVYALVDPANKASRRILLRLGFISEKSGQMDGLPTEIFGMKLKHL